jgi:hypothetical protein
MTTHQTQATDAAAVIRRCSPPHFRLPAQGYTSSSSSSVITVIV